MGISKGVATLGQMGLQIAGGFLKSKYQMFIISFLNGAHSHKTPHETTSTTPHKRNAMYIALT